MSRTLINLSSRTAINYYRINKRNLLTPIEHIKRTDIDYIPFVLVMSLTAGLWSWESYQHLQDFKVKLNSFESALQSCLVNNQLCEHVEKSLNSLLTNNGLKEKQSAMLVRVNTKSANQVELTKDPKSNHHFPLICDESE